MRDSLHKFGNLSLATADTDVYSADFFDLGALTGSRFTKHTLDDDLYICFRNTTAFLAADSYVPFLYQADDDAFTTNAEKAATWPESDTEIPAGKILRFKVPKTVRRYIKAGATPKSTGTFTAETVESWLELGATKQDL
jgi:hypothetical protein